MFKYEMKLPLNESRDIIGWPNVKGRILLGCLEQFGNGKTQKTVVHILRHFCVFWHTSDQLDKKAEFLGVCFLILTAQSIFDLHHHVKLNSLVFASLYLLFQSILDCMWNCKYLVITRIHYHLWKCRVFIVNMVAASMVCTTSFISWPAGRFTMLSENKELHI